MARCRSCDALIVWAKDHETGKPAPIDARGDPNGNVILLPGGKYRVLTKAEQAGDPIAVRTPRYTSHFQTCPDADRFRR